MRDDFYSDSLFDGLVIDRLSYGGRGRPRKTDYITIREAYKKYNKYWNQYLDLKMKQIYPPIKIK